MTSLTWLNTSLFCNKKIAHQVLKDGIKPFISQYDDSNFIKSWFFEFSNLLGSNIRLYLLVPPEHAPSIALNTKLYFDLFFEKHNFPVAPISLPINALFLRFPENSIQFGLFNQQNPREGIVAEYEQNVSEVLLEAIGENIIDDEITLTLCLYLHFALKKKLFDSSENDIFLRSFYENEDSKSHKVLSTSFLQEKLESNRPVVMEILTDIHNPDFYTDNSWLIKWNRLCADTCNKGEFRTDLSAIVNTVYKQLDVSVQLSQLLRYLILSTWNNLKEAH